MNAHLQVINRPARLDTAEAADRLRIRPQTLRRALCLQGHYYGMRPTKLPNGRLLWSAADLDQLTGEASK